jgi:hypothetical protein
MTAFPAFSGWADTPGVFPAVETFENAFIDYNSRNPDMLPVLVVGSSRDSQNTSTSMLRAGLAMGGPIDAGQTGAYKVKQWDPTATDGSQFLLGFLKESLKVVDANGDNTDKYTSLVIGGNLYSDRIIIPGNAAQGISGANAEMFLQMCGHRFLLDKNPRALLLPFDLPPMALSVLGASPNTLTVDHSRRTWTNSGDSGARTVNLPAPVIGYKYRFHRVAAQSLVVATTSTPTIIAQGNLAADQITLASDGAYLELVGYSATQYLVTDGAGTLTAA